MPDHAYIKEFAERIAEYCDYRITNENAPSRVILLENTA